jgi:glutaredoxin-like protein
MREATSMSVLKPSLQAQIRELFEDLPSPVILSVFTSDQTGCEVCEDTRQLAEELAFLSGGTVSAEVHDIAADAELARMYGVDKTPAIVVLNGAPSRQDYGIRFFGIPSGYEFGTLIEDIRMVSRGGAELAEPTLEMLSKLQTPLHIQVYVTPTCPYCPRAVLLAHKLALASDLVTADMVDASEFPELADKYGVYGVPRTVVNETLHIEGAVPETALVAQIDDLVAAAAG